MYILFTHRKAGVMAGISGLAVGLLQDLGLPEEACVQEMRVVQTQAVGLRDYIQQVRDVFKIGM